MSRLWEAITASDLVYRLGWTLLHSIWLGALVAALLALATQPLRRRSANARYLAGCAALVSLVGLSLSAYFFVPPKPPSQKVRETAAHAFELKPIVAEIPTAPTKSDSSDS